MNKGSVFLNGNVQNERDLFILLRDYFVNPKHIDSEVNKKNQILLGTASWKQGELNTEHIENAAKYQNITNNFDNLKAYTYFSEFEKKEPKSYEKYHNKQENILKLKKEYFLKNQENIKILFETLNNINKKHPNIYLWDIMNINQITDKTLNISDLKKKHDINQINKILNNKEDLNLCKIITKKITEIKELDNNLFNKVIKIEHKYLENSNLKNNTLYKEQREKMINKINKSAHIIFFGGHTYVINNRLRFYKLEKPLKDALKKGTNIYGISAGTIILMNKFLMNFDIGTYGGFLRAEDYGLNIVKNITVFPHANEYNYFMTPKPNYASFFSIRNKPKIPIGISMNTILKYDMIKENHIYKSIGSDPAYVFNLRGEKININRGESFYFKNNKLKIQKCD